VSPVDGRVDEVGATDRWDPAVNEGSTRGGIFVSVVGVDGVRYYGSHLAEVARGLGPGDAVRAGQPLGRIGDSGSARGTGLHLHFGISWPTEPGNWWVRRGVLAPQPYLDSWRAGGDASPARAVQSLRDEYGDDSTCRAYC
jgi:peptidoglycan LD-endopeptidase LytH